MSSQMDPEFYRAANSGKWEAINKFSAEFHNQQTVNGNTILHILAQSSHSSADAVKHILARKPNFAFKKNTQYGETPLLIASRRGYSDVVRALIDFGKGNGDKRISGTKRLAKMLGACDHHGNNALHEAVRNNQCDVVKLLVEEDPEFYYRPNFAGESPLYLAAEKGNHQIVSLILSTCKTVSTIGPGEKTALHAAAVRNSPECMKLILEKRPDLTKEVDVFGWTALHFAAKLNHTELVKLLLSSDKSMAYLAAKGDDGKTALHIAVIHGHLAVMQEILLHCPDCWDTISHKQQNILHLAVENEHQEVLEFILKSSWASEIINMKDNKGSTPLHLYIATNKLEGYNLVNHPCVDKTALNKKGLSPLDIIPQDADKVTKRQSSIRDELVHAGATPGLQNPITKLDKASKNGDLETGQSYMVVATLIVTVTFAAGFTLPGGYDNSKGNEGMAVLSRKAAFIAFVVSDSLAMVLSFIAVLEHLVFKDKIIPRFITVVLKDLPHIHNSYYVALALTLMVIAFVTGLYAVLPVGAIKIFLIVIGSVTFLPFPVCFFLSYLKLMHAGFRRLHELDYRLESELREIFDSIV